MVFRLWVEACPEQAGSLAFRHLSRKQSTLLAALKAELHQHDFSNIVDERQYRR
jgi:hypothetical protein